MHIRSVGDVVDVVNIVTVVVGSIGGILALLADSAGVGAVELLAVSRQRVLDQMVDNGWIKESLYFSHWQRRHRRANCRALSAKLSRSQS